MTFRRCYHFIAPERAPQAFQLRSLQDLSEWGILVHCRGQLALLVISGKLAPYLAKEKVSSSFTGLCEWVLPIKAMFCYVKELLSFTLLG